MNHSYSSFLWCRQFGSSPDDAADVAQEVWTAVATHVARFRRERPDFRLVITFLWHDGKDVDSEGNAFPSPASSVWTELYLQNRAQPDEVVDVSEYQASPLVLRVESEHQHLAARAALFLATHCGGGVAGDVAGEFFQPGTLLALVGDFDSSAAFRRAMESPFARSSLEGPYPNRDGSVMA